MASRAPRLAPLHVVPRGRPSISGSSKDFYPTDDDDVLLMVCKDTIHGRGRSARISGTGRLREEFCFHLYRAFEAHGISTHLARKYCGRQLAPHEPLQQSGILVRRIDMVALELIARFVARGHWVDAHKYPLLPAGQPLPAPVFECCIKWRKGVANVELENLGRTHRALWRVLRSIVPASLLVAPTVLRDDPRASADVVVAMHALSPDRTLRGRLIESIAEWDVLRALCLRAAGVLRRILAARGLVLEDGKFEVGLLPGAARSSFVLADECSQDSVRVRTAQGTALTKDLFRERQSDEQLRDAYAALVTVVREQGDIDAGPG